MPAGVNVSVKELPDLVVRLVREKEPQAAEVRHGCCQHEREQHAAVGGRGERDDFVSYFHRDAELVQSRLQIASVFRRIAC
jgi:hypothetical protein